MMSSMDREKNEKKLEERLKSVSDKYDSLLINTIYKLEIEDISEIKSDLWEILKESAGEEVDDIIEARFFSKESELKIIKMGTEYIINKMDIEKDENKNSEKFIYEKQLITKKTGVKNVLVIQKKLEYDEDGQAYVAWSRPYELIEKKFEKEKQE